MFLRFIQIISARAAIAVLVGMVLAHLVAGLPAQVYAWSEFGSKETQSTNAGSGPEIREPFFSFLLGMAAADSVGNWAAEDLADHASVVGIESRFPLRQVVALSRTRVDDTADNRYAGAKLEASWRIVLSAAQDRAMPYSILGYHPGSLRISAEMVLSELTVPGPRFDLGGDKGRQAVTDVRIFALEQGYILLDADGWLDALLGSALDDAWTLGFVVGRENGHLIGLGVSLGRDGRHIYGEFDFATDEVLTHGRLLVSSLSRFSRTWLNIVDGNLPTPWLER